MNFQPLTDEEIESLRGILEPGIYDFEVVEAKDKISKNSGNEMIELTLKVWDQEGQEYTLFDYLLPQPRMMWKLKNFCQATELIQEYKNGTVQSTTCYGKSGKVKTTTKEDKQYGKQVKVSDYVIEKNDVNINNSNTDTNTVNAKDILDDDLPF